MAKKRRYRWQAEKRAIARQYASRCTQGPNGSNGTVWTTTEAYRRKHGTGEFQDWLSAGQRARVADAMRRMG